MEKLRLSLVLGRDDEVEVPPRKGGVNWKATQYDRQPGKSKDQRMPLKSGHGLLSPFRKKAQAEIHSVTGAPEIAQWPGVSHIPVNSSGRAAPTKRFDFIKGVPRHAFILYSH